MDKAACKALEDRQTSRALYQIEQNR
jgi:hypothetical protein